MYRRGFTLIELLVAIALVAILSALLSSIGPSSRQYARDVDRKSDLEQIRSALELYRNSNTQYPACVPSAAAGCLASVLTQLTSGGYTTSIPGDPTSGRTYAYRPLDSGGGQCNDAGNDRCVTYTLCAGLEKVTGAVSGCATIANPCGSGVTCSYAVANP